MKFSIDISDEQQSTNEEIDQSKPQQQPQQRNQPPNSANNQSNTGPPVRPSQLHTQQMKQQQQQQPPPQQQQQQQQPTSSANNNVPPPLSLPNQDDHPSSHEPINPNQPDSNIHLSNAPIYTQHPTGTPYVYYFSKSFCPRKKNVSIFFRNPANAKGNSGLNPEADEFVPVFTVLLFFIQSNYRLSFFSSSVKVILDQNLVAHRQVQCQ